MTHPPTFETLAADSGPIDMCDMCQHPEHTGDCAQPIGYDNMNGDHECGCPGSLEQIRAAERLAGVLDALQAIRDHRKGERTDETGDSDGYDAGMDRAEELLLELEERMLNPIFTVSRDKTIATGNGDDSHL